METGHFMPKESRKEVAKEVKKTHFTLGSDKGKLIIVISLNIVDYGSKKHEEQHDANWHIGTNNDYQKFGQMIKQSHLQIGENNKFSPLTTHMEDYNRKSVDLARVQAAIETKKDLRKAHFNLGHNSDSEVFVTTNMERFKRNTMGPNLTDRKNIADGKERIRSVNIVYGNEKPLYQSTTKEAMVSHDISQTYQVQQETKEKAIILRQHNFQLGYGQPL